MTDPTDASLPEAADRPLPDGRAGRPRARPGAPRALPRPARPRARASGGRRRRRDARSRRSQRGAARALPRRPARRRRPRPGRARLSARAARAVRRRAPSSCTPSTTSCPRSSTSIGHAARRRDPVRPRRLLDAARRGRSRLRLRAGRAARHADGPDHRHHRRRGAQHLRRRRADAGAARLRRGAVRPSHRRDRRPRARARSRSTRAPGSSSWSVRRSPHAARRTGGNPAKRTFQALRIEVNGGARGARAGDAGRDRRARPSAVGSSSCPTSRSRTGSSSARYVSGHQPRAARHAGRARGHEPELRLRHPWRGEGLRRPRSRQNPRAASVRLRAAERMREAA